MKLTNRFRWALVSAVVALVVAVISAGQAAAMLSSTPYMGWNTYYGLVGSLNQATIESVANTLISTGLAQAGYRIVWLDFGWATGARASNGQLIVNPTLWPDGMAGLTAWLHARGLLAGIYTDAGATGCQGEGVGSLGHYQQDANTFAAWGFDAVKVDFCGAGQEGQTPQPQYTQFAEALANNSSHRPMLLNVDNFWEPGQIDGTNPSWANSAFANYLWAPPIAQSWRTDTDIGFGGGRGIAFADVLRNLDADAAHPAAAGPGHWNDPDYLGPQLGMTSAQAQAQLSMWAIVAAPLIIGSDPRTLSAATLGMLENPEVIAIDQDPLGVQGTPIQQEGAGQVWVKPLANGDRAVALLNTGNSQIPISTTAAAAGLAPTGSYAIYNVWQGTSTTTTSEIGALVPPTSVVLYRVRALDALKVSLPDAGSGTVTSKPAGISCPGTCSAAFEPGVAVSLHETRGPESKFVGWSGAGCWRRKACVIRMHSDQAVNAKFAGPTGSSGAASSTGSGVRDWVMCRAPIGLRCRFTETLTTVEKIRGGKPLAISAVAVGRKQEKKTRTVVAGGLTAAVPTRHARWVAVRLNKTGRRLFSRFGKLPVTLTIELTRNGNLVRVAERELIIRPQGPPTGTTGQVGSPLETIRLVWPVL